MNEHVGPAVVDRNELNQLVLMTAELRARLARFERSARPLPAFEPCSEPAEAPTVAAPAVASSVVAPAAVEPPAIVAVADPAPEAPPHTARVNWEMLAGGRLLNAAGAIVLVIGLTLLLKYAFEHDWIDEIARIALGVVGGSALLAIGALVHRRERRWFANGLLGAGIGLLYLSGFGSFQSYHLVPFALAYGFMSCVTVAAFALAYRYDSLPLAAIGFLGGFITPLALGESIVSQIGAASYLLLLDFGILAVAYLKPRWQGLHPAALFASYAAAIYWHAQHSAQASGLVSALTLFSLWAAFYVFGVGRARRGGGLGWAMADACNFGIALLALHGTLPAGSGLLQGALFAMTAAYAGTYAFVRRGGDASPLRVWTYMAAVIALADLDAQRFTGSAVWTALSLEMLGCLAIEAAVRIVKGTAIARAEALWFPAAIALAAFGHAWSSEISWSAFARYNGGRFEPADLMLFAAFATFALGAYGYKARTDGPPELGALLRQAALAMVLVEMGLHFGGFRLVAGTALVALGCAALGTQRLLRDLEVDGLGLLAAASIAIAFVPGAFGLERVFWFEPIRNDRFASGAVLALALLGAAELYRRRSLIPRWIPRIVRLGGVGAALVTATMDVRDTFAGMAAYAKIAPQDYPGGLDAQLASIAGLEQLVLSGLWVAASLVLMAVGMRAKVKDLRLMALGLFDLTIVKAFFVDLSGLDMPYRIASFIGLGVVLLGVSFLYQRFEGSAAAGPAPADALVA